MTSGSPNSSPMMLRSHCRSTAELSPNHRYLNCFTPIIIIMFASLSAQYFMYRNYISSMEARIDETLNLSLKLKANYDNCIDYTEQLIKREISFYDADKTNLADYALESSGATIILTRCSKSYLEKNIQYSIDGLLPVFFTSNSPRVVIQPSITPGECWSFAGATGNLVVQLSREIVPTSFTYEHIPKNLSPDQHIDSAPNHFRVKSLKSANDQEGLLLGEYDYDKNSKPLQQFKVQNRNPIPTRFIELIVQSNHGELQYTCLYRFRVHGNKIDQ